MNVTKYKFQISDFRFQISNLLSFAFCILIIICSVSNYAYAHKVSIYAYAEDGKVFAEGYFVDGSKAKNSLVEVFDIESGKKLIEVKTDEKGEASFEIPEVGPLKLVITASMGHKNDYTISENEVRESMGMSKAEVGSRDPEESELIAVGGSQIPGPAAVLPATVQGLSSSEVEAIVERALEKKLRPIKNILLQVQESLTRPGISEVLGGIGYILGLMGIVMYFKSRRR